MEEPRMNRVIQITNEIKELELEVNQLKKRLKNLQKTCEHEFQKNDYNIFNQAFWSGRECFFIIFYLIGYVVV